MAKRKAKRTKDWKVLDYTFNLIKSHQLHIPFKEVNLYDAKLFKNYWKTRKSMYDTVLERLALNGCITNKDDYYINNGITGKCYLYDLDIVSLIQYAKNHHYNINDYLNYLPKQNNTTNKIDMIELLNESKERINEYEYHINNQLVINPLIVLQNPLEALEFQRLFKFFIFGKHHYRKLKKIDEKGNVMSLTKEDVKNAIVDRYSYVWKFTAEKVMQINKSLNDSAFHRISYNPTTTYSKDGHLTKIGIRATNPMCNLEKSGKLSRDRFLNMMFDGNYSEYDVCGSVPRVARFINTREWSDKSEDPYEEIWNIWSDIDNNVPPFWDIETGERVEVTRDLIKQLFMKVYFGGSTKEIIKNFKYTNDLEPIKHIDGSVTIPITPDNWISDLGLDIETFKEAVECYVGQEVGKGDTTVFFHESNIYIYLRHILMKKHIRVAQVYDAFFVNPEELDEDTWWKYLTTAALDYLDDLDMSERYYQHINNQSIIIIH